MYSSSSDNSKNQKNSDSSHGHKRDKEKDEISCESPIRRQLLLGGLANSTTEDVLRSYFQQFGTVVDAEIMTDPVTHRPRGIGSVTFAHSSSLDQVQAARPHQVDGRIVETRRAVPLQNVERPDEAYAVVKKLFVDGITGDLLLPDLEENLREYFGRFGRVTSVSIEQDQTAFVEFDDYDPVDKILLQQSHSIKNITLIVRKALSEGDDDFLDQEN